MKETESDRIERYIVKKYPDAKITPVGRSGFQVEFGSKERKWCWNCEFGPSVNFLTFL